MKINGKEINLDELELKIVDLNNRDDLNRLGHDYEAEFSPLTGALPNELGIYILNTEPVDPYIGYLLFYHQTPLGFCVVNIGTPNDFAEFYIIPDMRREGLGTYLASKIFEKHPGLWQARQIQGAHWATDFCRNTLKGLGKDFTQDVISDIDYGKVTRQLFQVE